MNTTWASKAHRRAFIVLSALLLSVVLSVFPNHLALAAEPNVLGVSGSSSTSSSSDSEESTRTAIPDSFGRDTPRHTVQGFISALSKNDYLLASNYLNLTKADNPTTVVRQFKRALDAGGRFQADLQINNTPEGNLTDQLPPNQERVGNISINDKSIPLMLERVVSPRGEQYWQFSTDTLGSLSDVLADTEPTLISRYTIEGLEDKKLLGYQLTDLVAAIALTVSSFIFTYVLVWLCYHFLRIVYPRVRGESLPIPDKVILPLAVVIMALILSEVLVYAGVSVTLREPVNRFTEIASWLATTWLLLRIIDVIFTRAVNLSYKKNYTERVSILGLLRKVVKALLLIFAIIVIFGNLGFDLTTGIAALGVGGLALALGAQKTIENLVGSVVVVADSPVRIGDYCKFGTYEGTVIDIGIRSSRVRTLNRTIVTVPNGDFSSMQIENFTSRDMFHFLHYLYIKRSADMDVVFKMVKDLDTFLNEHTLTNQEWNQANISELRQDCYVIQLRAYINSADVIEFYGKQDQLLVDIFDLLKNYKVEHALPTQQLLVHQENTATDEKDDDKDASSLADDQDKTDSEAVDHGQPDEEQSHSHPNTDSDDENGDKTSIKPPQSPSNRHKARRKLNKAKRKMSFALAKRKFKHLKRTHSGKSTNLSIWNQPWH